MSSQSPEYYKRHRAVYKARGKASEYVCSCGETAKCWAQRHGTDGNDPYDYDPMCWQCHHKYDGRWSPEERAKVAASVKKTWSDNPERRVFSESHRTNMSANHRTRR